LFKIVFVFLSSNAWRRKGNVVVGGGGGGVS
jgi:hypothetical protein